MEYQECLFRKPNHLVNLNDMRLSGRMCDVTIKVNNEEFRAHKIILATSLKYYDSMFSNCFQESKKDVITMKGVKANDLETFITFAYTGEILLTNFNALSLLELANYLSEDFIKEACISFLVKSLKKKDAYHAYKLANNTIDDATLRNASRSIITSNFEYFSKTMEYFELDSDSLKDIMPSADLASSQEQKMIFEGVIRWVIYDLRNRRIFINELLDILHIVYWDKDFLFDYLSKSKEIQDHEDIKQEIKSFYTQKKEEMEKFQKCKHDLMILGYSEGNLQETLQVQFYDFTNRKWSTPLDVVEYADHEFVYSWTILNNKMYYTITTDDDKANLQVFDPATKKNMIIPRDDKLLRNNAMSKCNKYLYICGGDKQGESSNEVWRYDPQTRYFEILSPMRDERENAIAIFYRGRIHVLGGSGTYDSSNNLNSVEKYNPNTNSWVEFPSMIEERSCHAVAVLNGVLYACGGLGNNTVEVFDLSTQTWRAVANMERDRSNFLVVPYKGKLLAIGGDTEYTVEVYDPCEDMWELNPEMSLGLEINCIGGGLIPSNIILPKTEE